MTTVPLTRFGAEIREHRRRKHLSESALASAVGISLHTIHEIETGKTREPGIIIVLKLCRVLGITPDVMAASFDLGGEESSGSDRSDGLDEHAQRALDELEYVAHSLAESDRTEDGGGAAQCFGHVP